MESGKESGQAEDLTEQAKEPNPLDAKKEAVVEQVANLRGEVQQEVIAQAVGSVAPHAKVAAAKEAVKSANDAVEKEIVVEAVRTADTLDAKVAAAKEAVKSAEGTAEKQVVVEAVKSADTLGAKVAAATEAVGSSDNGQQKEILKQALHAASDETRDAIGKSLMPDQNASNKIWLMVVGAFAFVLCASAVALIAAVFIRTDQGLAQILLTVFTTVAGILAGFISGKAVGTDKV